jgi:hypothetical protein
VNTFSNISAATAAVANRFVTSTNMKVGTYTIVNSGVATWAGGFLVTLTHTGVTGTDTLGTVTIVGVDMAGAAQTEVITPVADSLVTGTKIFRSITSATGAGWVINTGNDTLVIGNAAGAYLVAGSGQLHAVVLNNSVAAAIPIVTAKGTLATIPASAAAGLMYLYNVDIDGYLKVTTTSTNDVTVIHSPSLPQSYAMS